MLFFIFYFLPIFRFFDCFFTIMNHFYLFFYILYFFTIFIIIFYFHYFLFFIIFFLYFNEFNHTFWKGPEEPLRIILCGDSAGGNLSLTTCVKAIRDQTVLPPIGLLLHYPATILSFRGSLSRLIFSNDPILNYQTMEVVLNCYLAKEDVSYIRIVSFAPFQF